MDAAKALIESCGQIRTMTKDIYAPETGETIQIGQQTNSFSISLSDELLKTLKMSRVCNLARCFRMLSHANSLRLVVRGQRSWFRDWTRGKPL